MLIKKLDDFTGGWFVGDFEPSLMKTSEMECAIKKYKAGDREPAHYHAVATEITVVVSGTVQMNNKRFREGDIIVLSPNEVCEFAAITDAVNAVVKIPSAAGDKYIVEEDGICST